MVTDFGTSLLQSATRLVARVPAAGVAGVVETGLVLVLAFLAAQVFWTFSAPASVGPAGAPASTVTASVEQTPRIGVLRYDPFHRDAEPVAEKVKADLTQTAPETALDLKLYGVRALADAEAGSAIIRTPDHTQGAYAVGMTILDGVALAGVFPDRVVLSRNGVMESLFLDDEARAAAAAGRSADSPVDPAAQARADELVARRREAFLAASSRPRVETAEQTRDAEAVMASVSANLDDAPALLRSLGLKPRVVQGRMVGMYLEPSGNDTLLQQMGLQRGDVLLEVNSVKLTGPDRVMAVRNVLETADTLYLLIDRDGSDEEVRVDLAGLRP